MNPLVTVAVPTLGRSKYLRETLLCVLAQDYANLEILVSDNGSRDEALSLAQELSIDDPRVRFRHNDTTVSIHEHFTQCVQAARGEFFILVCDDDRINPRFVSELIAVATGQPDVNVVVPANETIDEHGTTIEEFATPVGHIFDGSEFVCHWLRGRRPRLLANVVTVLIRTDVLRSFDGYQGLAGGQNNDNLLFLQCAISGRVGFAHKALFGWRIHSRSYGSAVTLKQSADSARQFMLHLRSDPGTVRALAALSTQRRKQILLGVSYMTAVDTLFHITTSRKPVWQVLLSNGIHGCRFDRMFWFVVVRHHYWTLRGFLKRLVLGLLLRK